MGEPQIGKLVGGDFAEKRDVSERIMVSARHRPE